MRAFSAAAFDRGLNASVLCHFKWNSRRRPHQDSRLGQKAIPGKTRTNISAPCSARLPDRTELTAPPSSAEKNKLNKHLVCLPGPRAPKMAPVEKNPALTLIVKSVHRWRDPSIHFSPLAPCPCSHEGDVRAARDCPGRPWPTQHHNTKLENSDLSLVVVVSQKKKGISPNEIVSGEVCLCSQVVPVGWVSATCVIQHLHHLLPSASLSRSRRLEPAAGIRKVLGLVV